MAERHDVVVERIAYVVAAVVLVTAGALLKSLVLNWIVGPGLAVAVVVACTALLTPKARRP